MIIQFDTLNSRYIINTKLMTWERQPTERSGNLGGIEGGPLRQLPDITVGFRCTLVETSEGQLETISTSPVKAIVSVIPERGE